MDDIKKATKKIAVLDTGHRSFSKFAALALATLLANSPPAGDVLGVKGGKKKRNKRDVFGHYAGGKR